MSVFKDIQVMLVSLFNFIFPFEIINPAQNCAWRIPAYGVFWLLAIVCYIYLHQHYNFLPDSAKHMLYFYQILTLIVYISCMQRVIWNETIITLQYCWRLENHYTSLYCIWVKVYAIFYEPLCFGMSW